MKIQIECRTHKCSVLLLEGTLTVDNLDEAKLHCEHGIGEHDFVLRLTEVDNLRFEIQYAE